MANAPRIPKIPPLRTDIQEPQQSSAVNRPPAQGDSNGGNTASNGSSPQHRTSKEWYYYWSKVGEQVVQNTQTLAGLVTYGPHAARPDPSTMPNGAIAIESDRGAIYQNELIKGVPTWHYVAGTMWGTLNPDQRPTDLGVNEAGFEFRSVNTDPNYAPRTFVWSQAEWIETTLVLYGTHASRPAADEKTPPRTLYVETDRGNVMYQQQTNAWVYVSGVMLGTISPDQRPTGLGANDTGFQYRATDQNQEFYWSGSAWVQAGALPNKALIAYASGTMTLTTAQQSIPGCSLTLSPGGTWLITGTFDMIPVGGDAGNFLYGMFESSGVAAILQVTSTGARMTTSQQWLISVASGHVAQISAAKGGGTGGSAVGNYSAISAIWVSP